MDYRIQEVLIKIENNLSHPHSVDELAESVNISASHFQHLFRKEVGSGFTRYLKRLRLQRARSFFETTHLRVKEIRAEIGAANETHFWRDFKNSFGKTPNEYRKLVRTIEIESK